ncbi:MAG: OsmC family protein [Vicingaceae bacterium]
MNNYNVSGKINAKKEAEYQVRQESISFGINKDQDQLPNPAELLLGAFAACCLKNIERFSKVLKFEYEHAAIEVVGERQEVPTKLTTIKYVIRLKGSNINVDLLHKNLQKFGTIYNTLNESCSISGEISLED